MFLLNRQWLLLLFFGFSLSVYNGESANNPGKLLGKALQFESETKGMRYIDSIVASDYKKNINQWIIWEFKGKVSFHFRNLKEAKIAFEKSNNYFYSHFNKNYFVAQVYLGLIYKDMGDILDAQKAYIEALHVAPGILDKVSVNTNLAGIALSAGDSITASKYILENIKLLPEWENKPGVSYTLFELAMTLSSFGKKKMAEELFRKCLPKFSEEKDYTRMGFVCSNIADIYLEEKNYTQCLEWNNLALVNQQRASNPLGMADVLLSCGKMELEAGNPAKALDWFRQSKPYIDSVNYVPFKSEWLKGMAFSNYKTGQNKLAFEYYRQYDILQDSISRINLQSKLAEQQVRFETLKKEITIHSQAQQLMQVQVISKQKTVILYSVIGFSIIILGFLIFYIRTVRKENKSMQQIIQLNTKLFDAQKKVYKMNASYTADNESSRLWDELLRGLETQKWYCNPDLTIAILVRELNTNRTRLSEIINNYSGKSFNVFINEYRIAEACKLLTNSKYNYLSIEGIAKETGFNSRSAFYSAFNSIVGITPFVYRKNCQVSIPVNKNYEMDILVEHGSQRY
jgi:AraC-like DNA-binding protein